jgi:hypothetical protein
MTNLRPSKPDSFIHQQSFQDLLCPSETDSFSDLSGKLTSISNPHYLSPIKSPITSPDSVSSHGSGFRASILKHGLTALEKIGRTTADVVTTTRNKIIEASPVEHELLASRPLDTIVPDFNDSKSSFYEVFQLYGGHSKLTVIGYCGVVELYVFRIYSFNLLSRQFL